jgi:hypothetical protein
MRDTAEVRFARYNALNPHIYDMLLKRANELMDLGFKQGSIKHIFNCVRWEVYKSTLGTEKFSMPDEFHALYARLLRQRLPEKFSDFFNFRTRTGKTETWFATYDRVKAAMYRRAYGGTI